MMFGSIFYNCWASLIAFSIYFFVTLLNSYSPTHILIGSFIVAIFIFIMMFPVRYFLYYILYTPEEGIYEEFQEELNKIQEQNSENIDSLDNTTIVEFSDESSEEIAKVVRTMMNQDIPVQN